MSIVWGKLGTRLSRRVLRRLGGIKCGFQGRIFATVEQVGLSTAHARRRIEHLKAQAGIVGRFVKIFRSARG